MNNDNMNINTWRRRPNRLDREVYRGIGVFAVTVTTWRRTPVFEVASEVERRALEQAAVQCGFRTLAYCFMPDHLHALVAGSETSDLAKLMKAFKQKTSFAYKQRTGQPLWQRSYYDHVLRTEEDIDRSIAYILDNPVRAGLVADWPAYPAIGGELVEAMVVAT